MRSVYGLLAILALCAVAQVSASEPPKDWVLAGSNPQDYSVGADRSNAHSGRASALLASKSDAAKGFGTLLQMVQAGSFQGKRLKFTAYVRSKGVRDWAGLWLRVDGAGSSQLAFDNMHDRPIRGDSDWQPYSIVLDVPKEATAIAFGILLSGPGEVWIDTGTLETVDKTVPTTGTPAPQMPQVPSNLDFEQ